MSGQRIEIDDLAKKVREMLAEYGEEVYEAAESALDVGGKKLSEIMNRNSPSYASSGKYRKSWKVKTEKYTLKRYVGSTRMVRGNVNKKGRKGDIPLSNILEYAEDSPHKGLIKETVDRHIDDVATAIVEEIRKGVK